jgi:hypothetical protein
VAKWPRLAGGKTRAVAMPSSNGNGAFALAVLGKGSLLYPLRGRNGRLTIRVSGVDDTELNKVSSWGLGVVKTVAEIDGRATSWRRTVMTLTQMRSNGLKNRSRWGEERESAVYNALRLR